MISCLCFPGLMFSFLAEDCGQLEVFLREMRALVDRLIDQSKQSICSILLVEILTARCQFPAQEFSVELQSDVSLASLGILLFFIEAMKGRREYGRTWKCCCTCSPLRGINHVEVDTFADSTVNIVHETIASGVLPLVYDDRGRRTQIPSLLRGRILQSSIYSLRGSRVQLHRSEPYPRAW